MYKNYTPILLYKDKIIQMVEDGKTHKEIADHFGFKDRFVVKDFLKRERRKERKAEQIKQPKLCGRPSKNKTPTEQDKDREIKRLKMENDLLRDFLHLAGRK